jgi:Tol biopolymer transport system component
MQAVPGRLRLVLVAASLAAFLVAPVSAHATLAFVRGFVKPTVWVALDDGSSQRRLAVGSNPEVSPDGHSVAYMRLPNRRTYDPELVVRPAEGGAPRLLSRNWREPFVFDWSPDSSRIAAVVGPELRRKRLVLIDVAAGTQRTIDRGFFSGVSFSPQGGEQLVYAKARRESYPPRSDIYRLDILPPGAVAVAPEEPRRLTADRRSTSPLWGPDGRIVFAKQLGAKQRRYGPKNELFLMDPGGAKVKRLTHTKVGPLLSGLTPTAWSDNGRRLLAEFGGQDTSYAVAVNPGTGGQRPLTKEREQGLIGAALSSDGKWILAATGGFEPGPGHDVVRVPYAGGRAKVLARNAYSPEWSR